MAQVTWNEQTLKRAVKDALVEALQEQRELLSDVLAEVLEDFALAEAVREGRKSKIVDREDVFQALQGKP